MIGSPSIPTLDWLRGQRDEILALSTQHGAFNIRVFGSIARGEAKLESDIDLLVSWDYTRISAWGGIGLDLALEKILGRPVDVIGDRSLQPRIRDQVLREAVLL